MNRVELYSEIRKKGSFLCVGLDSDPDLLPQHLKSQPDPVFTFNKAIIDATAPYCVAFKPNFAFYEVDGTEGWRQLEMTISYIKENYPEIMIIADAKRGDIGNTAQRYAKSIFETLGCHAATVAPYMGMDSITPFMEYSDSWTVVLALTSNKSADDFETLALTDGESLYKNVIKRTISTFENSEDNLMFVVGATRAEKLSEIREYCPDHFLLVPGVGAQGGALEDVAKYGMNDHCGLLVNASRSIIFAGNDSDFAEAAGNEARKMARQMSELL